MKRKQLEVMAHAQGQRQLQDALALPSVSEGEHTSKQFEFEGNYSERVYKHSIMDFPAFRTFAEDNVSFYNGFHCLMTRERRLMIL